MNFSGNALSTVVRGAAYAWAAPYTVVGLVLRPLFVPAYLLSSLVELLRGRRPYLDNCFEREAYGKTANGMGRRRR